MKINIAILDKDLVKIPITDNPIIEPINCEGENLEEAKFSITEIKEKYGKILDELNPTDNLIVLYKGNFLDKNLNNMNFKNDDNLLIIHDKQPVKKNKINPPLQQLFPFSNLNNENMDLSTAMISNLFSSILSASSNSRPLNASPLSAAGPASNINQLLSNINISDFLDNSLNPGGNLDEIEDEVEDEVEENVSTTDNNENRNPDLEELNSDEVEDYNVIMSNIVNNTNEIIGNAQGFLNQLNNIFSNESKYESEIKQL